MFSCVNVKDQLVYFSNIKDLKKHHTLDFNMSCIVMMTEAITDLRAGKKVATEIFRSRKWQ